MLLFGSILAGILQSSRCGSMNSSSVNFSAIISLLLLHRGTFLALLHKLFLFFFFTVKFIIKFYICLFILIILFTFSNILRIFSIFYSCLKVCMHFILTSLLLYSAALIMLMRPLTEFFLMPTSFVCQLWHFCLYFFFFFVLIYSCVLLKVCSTISLSSLNILCFSTLNSFSERL